MSKPQTTTISGPYKQLMIQSAILGLGSGGMKMSLTILNKLIGPLYEREDIKAALHALKKSGHLVKHNRVTYVLAK